MTDFAGLKLAQPLLRAIAHEGYTTPTPIQQIAIPPLLEGKDLLGVAQTGTGKTAAFALPVLDLLSENPTKAQSGRPRALVLAPTRELAGQIGDSFRTYGRHAGVRTAVVFGGASIRSQIQSLKKGVHVLVATPGRLMDLMNQGYAHLDGVEIFVLDEADRMLDMGFVRDVKKISAAIPKNRQTALFSATMPKSVEGLANGLLKDPVHVEVAPQATTAERVDQCVLFVKKDKKRDLLNEILDDKDIKRVLIFTRTKHRADRVVRNLIQAGVKADAIHGNKAQNARQRALGDFKSGKIRALVATDIAARGIDVDDITHVINFELPNDPDSYVHRIGRTARAGADGMAISFCGEDERGQLRDIEKTIRQSIAVVDEHPYHAPEIASDPGRGKGKGQGQGQKQRSGQKRPGQGRRKAHRKGQGGHGGGRPGGRSGGQAKAA